MLIDSSNLKIYNNPFKYRRAAFFIIAIKKYKIDYIIFNKQLIIINTLS